MAGAAFVKSVASVASVVLVLKAAFGGGGEVATAMEAVGNAPEEAAAVDHEGGSEGAAMGLGLNVGGVFAAAFGVGRRPRMSAKTTTRSTRTKGTATLLRKPALRTRRNGD